MAPGQDRIQLCGQRLFFRMRAAKLREGIYQLRHQPGTLQERLALVKAPGVHGQYGAALSQQFDDIFLAECGLDVAIRDALVTAPPQCRGPWMPRPVRTAGEHVRAVQ